MTAELIVLVASVLAIFVFGVRTGCWLSARRLAVRASRQTAARLSIYRQLHERQASRKKNRPAHANAGSFP
jgi:hypothetical protein